jgi:hypothetical protein
MKTAAMILVASTLFVGSASADPCGMVPPIQISGTVTGPAIQRSGAQRTWVMFKDGVQTLALRPGFVGKTEEFGMLIPFPAVPALRKIEDTTFAQLESAIDPPRVDVHVQQLYLYDGMVDFESASGAAPVEEGGLALRRSDVVVLKEEAVGMYEVAVLAAGGAQALQGWMTRHGFRYPDGMDAVVEDYVAQEWVFVTIKTNVGQSAGAHASPGMRQADVSFPTGSSFDGHVQGMGFRFRTERPVVPMRLSVFNGADPRNVVYMLTDEGVRIEGVDEALVVRQVGGAELYANVTEPLAVTFVQGEEKDLGEWGRKQVAEARNPEPHNGIARDLFAADLLATSGGSLSLPFEEEEKELLRISEALGLRGEEIDRLHSDAIDAQRDEALSGALAALKGMTLTVVDGVLPNELIASQNLTFAAYRLPARRNVRRVDELRTPDLTIWVDVGH